VNDLWARLMTEILGYERFGAHGGDWGSTITEQLARSHAESVVAIHLTDVPFGHIMQKPDDPSPAERKLFKHNEEWLQKEGAYALIQSSKPQSLAQGLNDSPVGLAAWLVEKFRAWSDCDGDIESCFTKDELLTHIMIYWATESIGSSFLTYYDYANASALTWMKEGVKKLTGSSKVPAAFALPEGYQSAAARMGGAILRCAALDRDAERRPFRSDGGTRITCPGHPHMVSELSRGTRHREKCS
jgi:hypothetical protein